MRSPQPSPLAGLLGPSAPRRGRSGTRILGMVLSVAAIILAIMLAIGFGVDQQARHHVTSASAAVTATAQQS